MYREWKDIDWLEQKIPSTFKKEYLCEKRMDQQYSGEKQPAIFSHPYYKIYPNAEIVQKL